MNKKIIILGSMLALLVVGGYLVLMQGGIKAKPEKIYHVGVVNGAPFFAPAADGFKQKMTELGYVEGVNIVYDIQTATATTDARAIADTFVQNGVDLIYAFPVGVVVEAKKATKGTTIPIVSIGADSPGVIDSIQRPGGNITGVAFPIAEVAVRRLEVLHELAPEARIMMLPVLKDYPTIAPSLASLGPVAERLRLTFIVVPVADPGEVVGYLKEYDKKDVGFDAILILSQPLAGDPEFMNPIYDFADKHGIPVGGVIDTQTPQSSRGLFSLIPEPFHMGELTAPLADKIFRGTDPGSIPIVTPEMFLEINSRAVTRLGLTINESLLNIANKIDR